MAKHDVKLIRKEDVADGTMAFYFEKPEGFVYKAGQSVDITLSNPPETDAEGNTRAFSLASAPFEDALMIATRMRDTAFKRVLSKMAEGASVSLEGPFGSFTLQNDTSRPAVFLIGGIGITPIFSIIKQASHDHTDHKLYLFYSNRQPKDAAFLDECRKLQASNKNFTFIPSMSKLEDEKAWSGEQGYIRKEMVSKYLRDVLEPVYYLAGPASMVQAMRQMLADMGVNDDNIRTEEFSGY